VRILEDIIHAMVDIALIWKEFCQQFDNKYFPLLANKHIHNIAKLGIDEFLSMPNVLFYGNRVSLISLFVDAILARVLEWDQLPSRPSKKVGVFEYSTGNGKQLSEYLYTDYHIEIDFQRLGAGEKDFITSFISGNIACTKNVLHNKHIVVLHNVDCMTQQTAYALRMTVERYTSNVFFILTCGKIGGLEKAIASRCAMIRCNIPSDAFENTLERVIDDFELEIKDKFVVEDPDFVKVLFQLCSPTESVHHVKEQVFAFLDRLLKMGTGQLLKVVAEIREMSYKLLHFGVPLAGIMKYVVDYFIANKKYAKYVIDVATISASLEHKSIRITKPNLVLEEYFLSVYHVIK
jgi:hypothetical protein